jgi:hypothetical protein
VAEESLVIHRNFNAGARDPKLRISLAGHWASMPISKETGQPAAAKKQKSTIRINGQILRV